jgi:hypothetical protein
MSTRMQRLRNRSQAGYVMVVTTIVLPLLLMMVAFAVDITIYFFRSVQLQRAADSSALAGVALMPRAQNAKTAALEVAKLNGYDPEQDTNIEIKTWVPNGYNTRFSVSIRDRYVPIFFGRLIKENWDIERRSTGEYLSSIPLGSAQNAIGTGYLEGIGKTDGMVAGLPKQNFWLAVSGPCAAKESGDQLLSKYDGNAVNPAGSVALPGGMNSQGAYICDVNPSASSMSVTDQRNYIKNQIDDQNPATPNTNTNKNRSPLFPGLSGNRDYKPDGYNYIIDVPCVPLTAGAAPPPPPCETSFPAGKDLVIQVYDPVFNPASVAGYINGQERNPAVGRADLYGLNVPPDVVNKNLCTAANPAGCIAPNVTFGQYNPRPEQIRMRTEFRLYPPDSKPMEYGDDVAMALSANLSDVTVAAEQLPYVTAAEAGKVARFGSCNRWTDNWTQYNGTTVNLSPRSSTASTGVTSSPYNVAAAPTPPFVLEPTTWVDTDPTVAATCTKYMDKWVNLTRIPAATIAAGGVQQRGRYRLNVRTIDAQYSFGTNSFAIRAFFVPSAEAAPETYTTCSTLTATDYVLNPCSSVAGDSSMSVFASIPDVSRFYLARLSPPGVYRGKKVVIQLWDPGEGGDQLQVLRPRRRDASNVGETCTLDNDIPDSDYCVQSFEWTIINPGVNALDAVEPLDSGSAVAMPDVCVNKGQSSPLVSVLQISGNPAAIPNCTNAQPLDIINSRARADGKFNDRLVGVVVEIPTDYGCTPGTGVPDLSGNMINCVDIDPSKMQAGWWKIKYIPIADATQPTGYKAITDRTTWAVGLKGDPVHLVPDDGSTPP